MGSTTASTISTPPSSDLQNQSSSYMGVRRFMTWFFLIISFFYMLYSTNLLNNYYRDCPLADLSVADERLSFSFTNTTTTAAAAASEEEEKTKEEVVIKVAEHYPLVQMESERRYDTELKHVVFCIAASSALWEHRKNYIKQWWRPRETRGVVWLDKPVKTARGETSLPDIRISGDTAKFPYTYPRGHRSAVRISRIVSETVRLGWVRRGVRWLVMGDDDTVFVADNVVRVLSKYDHRQMYYVGSSSESHLQNIRFTYGMAYGGGGFAISYPLAVALERMQDRCLKRYSGLYGSDDRIQACMAELGVPLTREAGFHQYDVYGSLVGLLMAHPVTPLVSLHHIDVVDSIFPGLSRTRALQRLFQSIALDSASVMQQSICYDKKRQWSVAVSWGYAVQVFRGMISPRELEMPSRTFLNWYRRADYTAYAFNTKPVARHPCQKPYTYYMTAARNDRPRGRTMGIYHRQRERRSTCRWNVTSPESINSIVVLKKPDSQRWIKSPRRDCCRVMPSGKSSTLYISVDKCQDDEFSEL